MQSNVEGGKGAMPEQHSSVPVCLSDLTKLRSGCGSGYLSTWPSHATSLTVGHRRKDLKKRDAKNHGCSPAFSDSVGKPRFLMQLEGYLKRELQALDLQQPKLQERRLQTYREVFDCFIEDFKTYKPLLTAIKNEYEATFEYMQEQIRELQPLKSQLTLVSEQCERRIVGLKEEERVEMRSLRDDKRRLQRVIDDLREKQRSLEAQVSRLQEELGAQYLAYRNEYDARKLLIANIGSMNYGAAEESQDGGDVAECDDPVKVKLALKVCREDLTKAQVELNRLHSEYGDVVPRRDWESLDRSHQENVQKLETLQTDFDVMKSEYDTLLEVHKQVTSERDSLQAELEVFQGTSTPRPDWDNCAEMLGSSDRWAELFEGQSSQRRLLSLLGSIAETTSKDYFQGLGSGSDVPVYLHYEGQLKNLKLKRADVVRMMKEVMKQKRAADEEQGVQSEIGEFLHKFLERQHGERAGEWAYSLLEVLQHQRSMDDLIGLFSDILAGKVDESVYYGQLQLVNQVLKTLIQADTAETGILTISDLSEALKKAFPLKSEHDLNELLSAAQAELESTERGLAYQRLFTEDLDSQIKGFVNLVKRQATAERYHYVNQLRIQLEGKREVDVADLRTAFTAIDPSLDSQALDANLGIVFRAETLNQAQSLDTEVALQRLQAANVSRAGPPAPHI
ncbi:translin-associated factor X-interacting protein 1 [Engraulis encrasicolus]|uniref:translin-associated factor X-interacting protein 1 n=1 Tax=Engraulis encrasicolus TaxID=184585 RepID=UPI002FD6E92C